MSLWIIRRVVSKGDYNYALVPQHPFATKNGYVLEHRIIMENSLGRILSREEIVHHIDGDRKNNLIENLCVLDRIEHLKLHGDMHKRERVICICKNCGAEFVPKRARGVHVFCSRRCNGLYTGFKKSM